MSKKARDAKRSRRLMRRAVRVFLPILAASTRTVTWKEYLTRDRPQEQEPHP